MRKLIYSIGVTVFLAFLTFHVTTSLTNPFYGVSMEALAQGSGSGGSDTTTTCTVKSFCFASGQIVGEVSCTGKICSRGLGWVKCDHMQTNC